MRTSSKRALFYAEKVLSVTGPVDERLEILLIALHGYTHIRRHPGGGRGAVLDRWSEFCPAGAALAKRIGCEEQLQNLVLSDCGPGDLIDGLDALANRTKRGDGYCKKEQTPSNMPVKQTLSQDP